MENTNTPSIVFNRPPARWYLLIFGFLAVSIGVTIGYLVGKVPSTNLLIVAALGFVIVLLSLANLEFGLLVFIVMTYLRVSDIGVYTYNAPSIARPFFFLLVVAIVLRWAVTGNLPKGWLAPAILILSYGLIVFGSIFYAADLTNAESAAQDYWKDGLIAVLVAALIQNRSVFRHVIWALLLSGIFVGSLSVYQYLTGSFTNNFFGFAEAPLLQIVDAEGYRVAGPIGDPNFYAQIMVVLVPLAINRMSDEKSLLLKLLAAYGVLVISLTVIFTFSRGGFIALAIALCAAALYRPPRLSMTLVLLAVSVVSLLLLPSTFTNRFSAVTGIITGSRDIRSESSLEGRASEMITAWQMFIDHPILGVGVKNYPVFYQKYSRQLGLDDRTTMREPHNLYLEVAAETGILGLLIFFTILFYVFHNIHRAMKDFALTGDADFRNMIGAYASGFIGYLAASVFIHGAYPRYLWLLVGIAFSLSNILKNEIDLTNIEK